MFLGIAEGNLLGLLPIHLLDDLGRNLRLHSLYAPGAFSHCKIQNLTVLTPVFLITLLFPQWRKGRVQPISKCFKPMLSLGPEANCRYLARLHCFSWAVSSPGPLSSPPQGKGHCERKWKPCDLLPPLAQVELPSSLSLFVGFCESQSIPEVGTLPPPHVLPGPWGGFGPSVLRICCVSVWDPWLRPVLSLWAQALGSLSSWGHGALLFSHAPHPPSDRLLVIR